MKIKPILAFTDNYIWTLIDEVHQQAIVIDAGQAEPVINFLQENGLELTQIWITHHHHDHIGGVEKLQKYFPNVKLYAHLNIQLPNAIDVAEGSILEAWGNLVQVWQIAGHTAEHLAFLLTFDDKLHIFCGDTLFSGGCGRVFTGTVEQLFESFDRINSLHDETALLYPAHEYTLANLKFAQMIEPNNLDIQQAIDDAVILQKLGKPTLPTNLANERKINPFLRVIANDNLTDMMTTMKMKTSLNDDSPLSVFSALRELKNNF